MRRPRFRPPRLLPVYGIFILAALLSNSIAGEEQAGPPPAEACLPKDTVLFVSFPSLGRAWEGFKALPLYQAYKDEEVQAFLESFGEGLEEIAPGISMDLVKRLLDLPEIFDGEAAFGLRFPAEEKDVPPWLVCFRADRDPAKAGRFVEEVLHPLIRAFFPWGPEEVVLGGCKGARFSGPAMNLYLCYGAGRLTLTTDRAFLERFLAGGDREEGTLSTTPAYQEAKACWSKEPPSFLCYATLEGLWGKADRAMDPEDRALLRASGFDGLAYLFTALTMEKGRARETVHLHVPGEKRGFFSVYTGDPLERSTVRLAPDNALLFLQANLDLRGLYGTVLAMGEASKTRDFRNFRSSVDGLAKRFGLRSFSDLVGLLGTELVAYAALPQGGGGLIPEAVLAIEVLEPDRLQANLAGVVETFAGAPPKTAQYRNRRIFYLPLGDREIFDLNLCWCFTDGYLLVGLHPTVIKKVIRRFDTGVHTLAEDPAFQAAWKGLPARSTAVGYTNTRRLFDYLYGLILPVASMAGSELPFDPALLPSGEAISQYLSFGLSGLSTGDGGLWLRTDSDGYGPTSLLLYGLTAAAFITPFQAWKDPCMQYPACGRAQKNIWNLLERYRQEHGRYPADLAEVLGRFMGWSSYACRAARTNLTSEEARDRSAAEDFEYIVTWKKISPPESFPPEWMVLWDSEARHNRGRIVLLGNGRVTWLPEAAFQERLEAQGR